MPQPFYLFVDHKLFGLQVEAFVNFGFDFHSHYSCMFVCVCVCVCFCMGVRRHWRSRRRARGKFRTLENIMTSSNDDFARYSQPPPRSFSLSLCYIRTVQRTAPDDSLFAKSNT